MVVGCWKWNCFSLAIWSTVRWCGWFGMAPNLPRDRIAGAWRELGDPSEGWTPSPEIPPVGFSPTRYGYSNRTNSPWNHKQSRRRLHRRPLSSVTPVWFIHHRVGPKTTGRPIVSFPIFDFFGVNGADPPSGEGAGPTPVLFLLVIFWSVTGTIKQNSKCTINNTQEIDRLVAGVGGPALSWVPKKACSLASFRFSVSRKVSTCRTIRRDSAGLNVT